MNLMTTRQRDDEDLTEYQVLQGGKRSMQGEVQRDIKNPNVHPKRVHMGLCYFTDRLRVYRRVKYGLFLVLKINYIKQDGCFCLVGL